MKKKLKRLKQAFYEMFKKGQLHPWGVDNDCDGYTPREMTKDDI